MSPCDHDDITDGCMCFHRGIDEGIRQAVENAWRSTMDQQIVKTLSEERDRWRAMYEELVKNVG